MKNLYVSCINGDADEVEIRNDVFYAWLDELGYHCVGKDDDREINQ